MKKLVAILSFLLLLGVLVACDGGPTPEPVDPAQAKIDSTYNGLAALISDPSNITKGFQVPAQVANGTTLAWSSSNNDVLSFGTVADGAINVSVNRPDVDKADVKVTITAVLTIASELNEGENLTKTWTLQLTIKKSTVNLKAIDTVAKLLAIVDPDYDAAGEVTIPNLTVFAEGADTAFAYDGTGVIQLYGMQSKVEIGKVYTVTATIDWYFGIWELTKGNVELQEDATPQYPEKEAINKVKETIDSLVADGHHQYTTVADGNMEQIYATITGKVYVATEEEVSNANYRVYIIDSEADKPVMGTSSVPASGLMVYYNTLDFDYIKQYEGIEVTMDVIIYTYRSNNLAFAIYYVGGAEGIEATLTDAQAVDVTLKGINEEVAVTSDNYDLGLSAVGAGDAAIVWSYKDPENANNSLINLTTGIVKQPTDGSVVEVVLVATVSKGDESGTKEMTVKIGLETSTIEAFIAAADKNALAKLSGVVVGSLATGTTGSQSFIIADATGSITVRVPANLHSLMVVGDKVTLIGKYNAFNNLHQLDYIIYGVKADTGSVPAAVDVTEKTLEEITQSQLVVLTERKVTKVETDTYNNITLSFEGTDFKVKWDSRITLPSELETALKAIAVDDVITITAITQANATFSFFAGSVIS